MTIANFLGYIGDFIGSITVWMDGIWNFLAGNQVLLLLILGVPLCGIGIGFLQRVFKLSR